MEKLDKNTNAVSPVIGVILMVGIAVILAAVIAVFVFGMNNNSQKTPVAALVAMNNPDTQEPDIKIVHKGGDMLIGGGWKLSIVPAGRSRVFIGSSSTSEFKVGQQFSAVNTTRGDASNLTSIRFEGGEPLMRGSRYDVTLIEYPSEALLFDDVIEVRWPEQADPACGNTCAIDTTNMERCDACHVIEHDEISRGSVHTTIKCNVEWFMEM